MKNRFFFWQLLDLNENYKIGIIRNIFFLRKLLKKENSRFSPKKKYYPIGFFARIKNKDGNFQLLINVFLENFLFSEIFFVVDEKLRTVPKFLARFDSITVICSASFFRATEEIKEECNIL